MEECNKIQQNLSKVDEWKKKSDSLLYSMIPKSIAVRLKNGENPINTCEVGINSIVNYERVGVCFKIPL